MGIGFIVRGLFYKESSHEKEKNRFKQSNGNTGSIIGDILYEIIVTLPWYIVRVLICIMGIGCFYLGYISI